jgi:hypothetical protein
MTPDEAKLLEGAEGQDLLDRLALLAFIKSCTSVERRAFLGRPLFDHMSVGEILQAYAEARDAIEEQPDVYRARLSSACDARRAARTADREGNDES